MCVDGNEVVDLYLLENGCNTNILFDLKFQRSKENQWQKLWLCIWNLIQINFLICLYFSIITSIFSTTYFRYDLFFFSFLHPFNLVSHYTRGIKRLIHMDIVTSSLTFISTSGLALEHVGVHVMWINTIYFFTIWLCDSDWNLLNAYTYKKFVL